MLSEAEAVLFNQIEEYLVCDLDPADVTEYLKSKRILSEQQFHDLKHGQGDSSRKSKSQILIEILKETLPNLDALLQALEFGRYNWLIDFVRQLQSDQNKQRSKIESVNVGKQCNGYGDHNGNVVHVAKEDKSVASVVAPPSRNYFALLAKGKIPKRPEVYVHRAEMFERLKRLVVDLQHRRGWVVLHGMAGTGKSILAAEVVRDTSILGTMFPQIFWIPFDRPRDISRSRDEKEMLMAKFHHLFSHVMTPERRTGHHQDLQDIEDALRRLPELMLKHCPGTLLVLDDIWSEYHVQKFDELHCRYVATTQNSALFYCLDSAKQVMPMNPSGFTRQEAMVAFASWLDCAPEKLPQEAVALFEEVDGHPFFICLVASFLKTHRNRWVHYYNETRNNGIDNIRLSQNMGSYKHKSFREAVIFSIENLDEDIKQKYLQLSVFPLKRLVPATVLAVFWNMTKLQVEDLMDQLVIRNLVTKDFEPHLDCDSYLVHNSLLHRFLKIIVGLEAEKQYHKVLVRNYEKFVKQKWAQLPKDGYIHEFIGFHVEQAGLFELLPSIYLDLKFVYDKSNLTNRQETVDELKKMTNHMQQQNAHYRELCDFLTRNLHTTSDLLTAALSEPLVSQVHQEALKYI